MPGKFELKKAASGFCFNLKASNGQIILSSEVYREKRGAKNGIESVRKNVATPERFDVRQSVNGDPYFVLIAANKQVIGRSEIYNTMRACKNGISSVCKHAPDAPLVDLTIAEEAK
jgi:uncharacterized protein YegP (UPF0339 family)